MNRQNCLSIHTPPSHVLASATPWEDEGGAAEPYHAPQLIVIGVAVDLVQGYSYGKYSDGYTGYYWER
jgi:hypothetical protein